MRLEKENKKT